MNFFYQILIAFIILVLSNTTSAAQEVTSGIWSVNNGATLEIDAHGECFDVTNNHSSGKAIMVPTGTATEWSSFQVGTPTGVTLSACVGGPTADQVMYFSSTNCSGATALAATGTGYACTGSASCTSDAHDNTGTLNTTTYNFSFASRRSPSGTCFVHSNSYSPHTDIRPLTSSYVANTIAYFSGADCTGAVALNTGNRQLAYACTGAGSCTTGIVVGDNVNYGSFAYQSRRGTNGSCVNFSSNRGGHAVPGGTVVPSSSASFTGANCSGASYVNTGNGHTSSFVYACTGSGTCTTNVMQAGSSATDFGSGYFGYRSARATDGSCSNTGVQSLADWYNTAP